VPVETKAVGMDKPSDIDEETEETSEAPTPISPEAEQAIQNEIDRRRDWMAFISMVPIQWQTLTSQIMVIYRENMA
jgi:hypothetical protein